MYKEWVKVKHNYIYYYVAIWWKVANNYMFSFSFFVILIVVASCTQLLSQAMYNLMMAAMAETCSC